jgi:hypothetical protein
MKILDPKTAHGRLRVALHGVSGARKTWLSTHLPDDWGRGVYISADSNSWPMNSTEPKDRERFIPVVPDGGIHKNDKGLWVTDWLAEFNDMCFTNWKEAHPEIEFVVWDGPSSSAIKLLLENMKMGYFSDKGPTNSQFKLTDPRFKAQKENVIKLGDKGDYRMVQEAVLQGLDWLIGMNPDVHIICTFHTCLGDGFQDGGGKRFGPSITGLKGPVRVPHLFGGVLHTEVGESGNTKVWLIEHDKHIAKFNTTKNHQDYYVLKKNPSDAKEFWQMLLDLKGE